MEKIYYKDYEKRQQITSILKEYLTELMKLAPFNDENVRESYYRIRIQIRGLNLAENIVHRKMKKK